eukprot:PhF_6_TR22452/c1_g1_i1/m.31848
MYTLLACADLFGEKINLELTFAAMPTIGELTRKIEDVYRSEADLKRPVNFPREYEFRVARLQIYDDVLLKWVDLVTATQLHEYDQLYAFQPQSPWHIDVQKDLPPPRPPTAQFRGGQPPASFSPNRGLPAYGGQQAPPASSYAPPTYAPPPPSYPSYASSPYDRGVPPYADPRGGLNPNASDEEKVRIIFSELDTDRDGYVSNKELRDGFYTRGIDFTEQTVGDLFFRADANRDGVISLGEFQAFARRFPNTIDSLYFRTNLKAEPPQLREIDDRMRQQKNREAELLRELERVRTENQTLEQRRAQEAEAARRAAEQRRVLEDQERQLLQKEYELQKQRDALRQSEAEFMQTARQFDQHSAQTGSPRRARMYQS